MLPDTYENVSSHKFGPGGQIYAFTTENLAGYLPLLQSNCKEVLSVAGSGDQALNSILLGAKSITLFDTNPGALYWTELKLVAVSMLSYAEFLRFFLRYSDNNKTINFNALCYDTYCNRLAKFLGSKARRFFRSVYTQSKLNGFQLRNSQIFNNRYDSNQLKLSCNLYLSNEREYNKVREYLKQTQIRLLKSCVCSLSKVLYERRYNLILLSNISDYLGLFFQENSCPLRTYSKKVWLPLCKQLLPHGKMCAAYLYRVEDKVNYQGPRHSDIDYPNLRHEILKELGAPFSEARFQSVISGCQDGIVLIGSMEETYNG